MNTTFINAILGTVKKSVEDLTWEDTRRHLQSIADEIMNATDGTGAMPAASVPGAKWSEMYLAVDTCNEYERDITRAICEKHGMEPARYSRLDYDFPTHYRAKRQESYT